MKHLTRKIFASVLAMLARGVVRKYTPKVVMITGSVGKTSTKDAVGAVLSQGFFTRASEKSYNSEFGVPLTILGAHNPWASPLAWIQVYMEAVALLILPNHYPKVLVLEVGADRPGDLAKILKIATPDVVVVTRLPAMPVHVEAYVTPEAVREEEFAPAYALAPGAPLILNADDEFSQRLAIPLLSSVRTFGLASESNVRIESPRIHCNKKLPVGMECELVSGEDSHTVSVRGALGLPQLYAPAAAYAVGVALGMKPKDILKGLKEYIPPAGRGRILRGKKNSILIDDSYNASPAAVEVGLQTLTLIKTEKENTRRIAVLGDMLELGRYSSEEHARIGALVPSYAEVLITVGMRAQAIGNSAKDAGMAEEAIFMCKTANDARVLLKDFIQDGDAVLIKGSQSIRTEKIVEELLFDHTDSDLLVRQDKEWKRR